MELGVDRGLKLAIKNLIVPSITGESALKATEGCERKSVDLNIVCVAFMAGGAWEVSKEPPEGRHWEEIPELKRQWEEWKEKTSKR